MSQLPANYLTTIARLKEQIKQSRIKAALKANEVLLELYWEIGQAILLMQQQEGWGAKVIDRIATDLKTDFPDFKGLSVRNLKYMVAFAKAFPLFGQQDAAQPLIIENEHSLIGQQLAAQLPWGHLQVLMDKVHEPEQMTFYMQKCIENGWSRNILVEQIKTDLYTRQGKAISNFKTTLPQLQSDLVQQTLKNPYLFDFLSLGEEARERDVENALIEHLKKFMLELGRGFAYVGRQKNLVVQGDDFFLDLLFYNYNLHCFVVFELKVGDFKPEYAGKLNFYVNTVNEQLKGVDDHPTIGVLLCKTPNETVVKYSLQGIESPIGVAEYQLSEALPKQLKGDLPSIEELETEIDKSYEELKSPQQSKLDLLKQKLSKVNSKPIEQSLTLETWVSIVDKSLMPLFKNILIEMEAYREFYLSQNYFWSGDNNITDIDQVADKWATESYFRKNKSLYFHYGFFALKQSGTDAWNDSVQLHIFPDTYWYGLSLHTPNNNFICKKLYPEQLTPEEINNITEQLCNSVNKRIEEYIIWKESNP